MSGQWRDSQRKARLPTDWLARRARVLHRDGHRCTWITAGQRCTEPATDVDHGRRGDDHDESNLRSLCPAHHLAKSAAEGVAARNQLRAARNRPAERHPGGVPHPWCTDHVGSPGTELEFAL